MTNTTEKFVTTACLRDAMHDSITALKSGVEPEKALERIKYLSEVSQKATEAILEEIRRHR